MKNQTIFEELDTTTELLQYFTSAAVTFAALDDSLAATGIGTSTFEAGDYIYVTGSSETDNNTRWLLTSAAANKLIASGAITDDTPGETITLNQEYVGDWCNIELYAKITGVINSSGNCTVYIDQSGDRTNTDYTTTVSVTGGTAAA